MLENKLDIYRNSYTFMLMLHFHYEVLTRNNYFGQMVLVTNCLQTFRSKWWHVLEQMYMYIIKNAFCEIPK